MTGGAVLAMIANDMLTRRPARFALPGTALGTASTHMLKAAAKGSPTRKWSAKKKPHTIQ